MGELIVLNSAPNAYCETFFRCLETGLTGSEAMVDAIRGVTIQPSLSGGGYSLTNGVGTLSNSVYPVSASAALSAGTWPDFALRPIILFACGRIVDPTAVRAPIGDGSGALSGTSGLISLSNGGGMHVLMRSNTDGGTSLVSSGFQPARALPSIGTDIGLIVEYTPKVETVARFVDLSGNTFGAGATETKITVPAAFVSDYTVNPGLNNMTRPGGLAFYSWLAFSFDAADGLPANREDAIKWMLANHSAGNRTLPPHWSYSAHP